MHHAHSIFTYWAIPDRLLLVKFAVKCFNLSAIQVYAPTGSADRKAVAQFHNIVDEAEQQCKEREASTVLGDTNGKRKTWRCGEAFWSLC